MFIHFDLNKQHLVLSSSAINIKRCELGGNPSKASLRHEFNPGEKNSQKLVSCKVNIFYSALFFCFVDFFECGGEQVKFYNESNSLENLHICSHLLGSSQHLFHAASKYKDELCYQERNEGWIKG